MSKVYIAGKTHDFLTIRHYHNLFKNAGHVITYDWTEEMETRNPISRAALAQKCYEGVIQADLLVAFFSPGAKGMLVEFGIGLGQLMPIWLLNFPYNYTVFTLMPQVEMVHGTELQERINTLDDWLKKCQA
jgi:hypothetical protein